MHSAWEGFQADQRFDLVFSSFCPAANDWRSLLRMESLSSRSCCFVATSDPGRDTLQYRILDALGPNDYSNEGYDVLYPFRFLYALGRCPSLRVFRTFVEMGKTPERMVQAQLGYLELLRSVGDGERRLVEQGPASKVLVRPEQESTRALLAAWESQSELGLPSGHYNNTKKVLIGSIRVSAKACMDGKVKMGVRSCYIVSFGEV